MRDLIYVHFMTVVCRESAGKACVRRRQVALAWRGAIRVFFVSWLVHATLNTECITGPRTPIAEASLNVRSSVVWMLLAVAPLAPDTSIAQSSPDSARSTPAADATRDSSKVDPAKAADIVRLMELTGMKSLITQLMVSLEASMKPVIMNSLPPGDYRDELVERFFVRFQGKSDPQQLLDLAVPVYDRYYTQDEIRSLIDFYQTPLGQKTISLLPKLTSEMQGVGKQWGQRLGGEAMTEVLAENPKLAGALERAQKRMDRP